MNQKAVLQVIEINNSDKPGVERFIDVPWRIYNKKEHPEWVPPLRMSVQANLDTVKNPFYSRAQIQLFLALRGGEAVGRIAAIDNQAHNEFHNEKIGFYGFFECMNDQEVADALFLVAEKWLKARGLERMRGPMNPSTNHECGLLVRGQRQHPTIMTTWNPKYYVELHEKSGLKGVKDTVAYLVPTGKIDALPPKVVAYAERVKRESSITFRDFDLKNFDREIDSCYDIYNSAWEKNWGFFPMTRQEFVHMGHDLKMVLDPEFAFVAEKHGKPAGFMLALPDYNYIFKRIPNGKLFPTGFLKLLLGKKLLKTVRILTLGVKPEFRGSNEAMNKPWRDLGCPLYRRWRIFER